MLELTPIRVSRFAYVSKNGQWYELPITQPVSMSLQQYIKWDKDKNCWLWMVLSGGVIIDSDELEEGCKFYGI